MAGNQPGRESASAAATREQVMQLVPTKRLQPPDKLMAEEKALFETTVASMPPGWFKKHDLPLLTAFVRHATNADRIAAQLIADTEAGHHPVTLKPLYEMLEKEQRAMSSAATRLRITPQTSYQAKKSRADGQDPDEPKPWEA